MVIPNEIKKIGIMTSGGDAPGMNSAIRSIVRTALNNNIQVKGIMRGFEGLLAGDVRDLQSKDMYEIMQKGGTILLTARNKEMMTKEGQMKAAQICKSLEFDALFIIGGDGSLAGGLTLSRLGINVIGIPGTIDLDLPCSEYTIGFDTAVNTAMSAINKLRDTSTSHERCSIVEVMGRNCGQLALWCSLISGADEVIVPESDDVTVESIMKIILSNRVLGKRHNLIVVAEGKGRTDEMAKEIESKLGVETRATILGHLQRGGSPTAVDRMHASIMGYKAVEACIKGEKSRIIVYKSGRYLSIDLEEGLNETYTYDNSLYDIVKIVKL
jgi:6-phosphofructokinase 1